MKNLTTLLFLVLCGLHFNYTLGQISDQELEKLLQSASEKKLVSKNTELLMNGFFYQSIPIASALLQKKDNANYNYRKGFAIFKTTSHFSKAIPYLKKAAQNTTSSFDYFSSREESAPLEATFYLGRIYHLMANIPKAKEYYHAYLENKPKDKRRKEKAQLMLQQCEVATRLLKNPNKDFKIINLGNKINSKYPDYAPIISLDGAVLYFTSRRLREDGSNKEMKELYTNMYFEDIYKARRIDTSSWGDPKLMAFCLPNRNEASVAVSPDERSIYIYQDDKGHGDLYVTTFYDNQFKELKPVPILGVNTDFWEPSITTTPDGQYKFFVSNREGGFGGRDIYRIVKLPNGEWSKPQNLGPTINTPYDEDAPFMAVDNKTLYFSSNGPKSMGKFDIFVSIFNAKDQTWSTPINLGPPLNSTGDDIYFTTTANGKTAYFTSYRADGYGEKDIYGLQSDYLSVKNAKVLTGKVIVLHEETLPKTIKMYLTCLNCDSGDPSPLRVQLRPSDGKFFASLEPCSDYKLTFKEGEKTIRQETFNTECEDGYQEIKKNITLDLNKGTTNSLTLNGKVTSQSGEPIPAEVQFNIQCIDCKDATKQQVYLDPKTGEYSTNLKPCHSYKISFSKEGKEFYKETFKTNCDTTLQTKNIQLDKYLINTSENKEYAPLAIKHYFGYNHNRINPNSGNLKSLFSTMGEQTKKGRNEFTLYVEASASKVTTSSFKNNQALAQTRADNIVQLLKQHLSTLPKLKGKVEIKVKSASVNGPTYHRGDYVNKQKYIPYQYVIITLKGKNSKEKVKIIKSKDKVIDNMPQK